MSVDSDVNAIFDLAAPSTPTTSDSVETDANAVADTNADTATPAQNAAEASAADTEPESTDLYPNVLRSYTVGTDHADLNTNPDGTMTVAEFAAHLTVENFKAGNMSADSIVKDANIYGGLKAKRHALPVVLVFPADSTDQKDAKAYLPVAEATEAYANRPTRGEGNAATSKRTLEDLLTDAAKKAMALARITVRLNRAKEQHNQTTAQMEKYYGWLATFYKDETDPEAARKAALDARIDELEAEADAAKNSDIPDAADSDDAAIATA